MKRKNEDMDLEYFPVPIVETAKSKHKPGKERETLHVPHDKEEKDLSLLSAFIREKIAECREQGFDEGAVVSERYSSRLPSMLPQNWGIVIRLSGAARDFDEVRPVYVQWVTTNKLASRHRPEDLYLIHRAKSGQDLELELWVQEEKQEYGAC